MATSRGTLLVASVQNNANSFSSGTSRPCNRVLFNTRYIYPTGLGAVFIVTGRSRRTVLSETACFYFAEKITRYAFEADTRTREYRRKTERAWSSRFTFPCLHPPSSSPSYIIIYLAPPFFFLTPCRTKSYDLRTISLGAGIKSALEGEGGEKLVLSCSYLDLQRRGVATPSFSSCWALPCCTTLRSS